MCLDEAFFAIFSRATGKAPQQLEDERTDASRYAMGGRRKHVLSRV